MAAVAPPAPRSTRERILEAASDLFYSRGIHAVGVEAIIERAGVAKMSLYNHFRSKDDLVEAFIRRRDESWIDWLREAVQDRASNPHGRLLAIFDALEAWFATDDFVGCGFINTAAEYPDEGHPVRVAVREHKVRMRDFIRDIAEEAGARDSSGLAEQLAILADGAMVRAHVDGSVEPARRARVAAQAVLKAQLS